MTRIRKLAVVLATVACGAAAPVASAATTSQIVGGTAAPAGAWPSIAFLDGRYDDGGQATEFHCTGSVVAPSWIVTAGHCSFGLPNQPPDAMDAVLGVTDYQDSNGEVIAIDRFVPEPSYDSASETNDVALLHLSRPTKQPSMRLATKAENNAGTYVSKPNVANAAGWGATDEAGTQFTTQLQQAYLQIQSTSQCSSAAPEFDPNTQTCAGTPGTAGVCFGDSGGPLVTFDASNGAPVLWGVTSYRATTSDESPCSLSAPAVFTWIPGFTDWIQSTISAPDQGTPATDVNDPTANRADPNASARKAASRCRRAKSHVTAAKRSERLMKRHLRAVRRLTTSPIVRQRVLRADRRYERAHARRVHAAALADTVCSSTS